MELLLHEGERYGRRPRAPRRLSTVGHGRAFRAFAHAARGAGVRFMVIGGTFRDIAVRPSSTRDIDVVLLDVEDVDRAVMEGAGFVRLPGARHTWRYNFEGRTVDLEIAALASSEGTGPFSVAFRRAETMAIEGVRVRVPRLEDYVVLKLFAAAADRRRRARDLADVQHVLEAFPERSQASLSIAAVRARLRELYGVGGQRLKELVALFREVPRPRFGR